MISILIYMLYLIFVYLISTFLGYLSHKLFHFKWLEFIAKSHLVHHIDMYPPGDLVSDKYRHAGRNTTVLLFIPIILSVLLITLMLTFLGILSIFYAISTGIEIILISILHNVLHDAFHLNKSVWSKLPGFKIMQDLHFKHHINMEVNFGIFDFTWDKIFKTFSK